MSFAKRVRYQDRDLLAKIRSLPCYVCNRKPSDASHIKTKGSGGPDTEWNVVAKCREHHTEWGMSWSKFLERYPAFALKLKFMGWSWEDGRLWHPLLSPVPESKVE